MVTTKRSYGRYLAEARIPDGVSHTVWSMGYSVLYSIHPYGSIIEYPSIGFTPTGWRRLVAITANTYSVWYLYGVQSIPFSPPRLRRLDYTVYGVRYAGTSVRNMREREMLVDNQSIRQPFPLFTILLVLTTLLHSRKVSRFSTLVRSIFRLSVNTSIVVFSAIHHLHAQGKDADSSQALPINVATRVRLPIKGKRKTMIRSSNHCIQLYSVHNP